MSENTKKTENVAKTAEKAETVEKTTAQNAPERVEKPKEVSTPKPKPIKRDAAADAIMREQLLAGSSPDLNTVNGGAGGRMTIDEMLHSYFAPTDMVTVKNPFDFDTGWVYADPKDLRIEQPSAETRRVYGIGREFQKTRLLHAGESLVLQGWEAYIGLTRFFKQWVMQKYNPQSINDMQLFQKFMSMVYGGIFDPNAQNNNVVDDVSAREALENDLGLADGGNV